MAKAQHADHFAKNIASAALLGLFIFLGAGSSETDSAADKVASEESAYNLTSEQLHGEYEANKVAAESKYKDKVVTITGPIQSIGKDVVDTAYLVIGGSGLNGVQCMFPKDQESAISQLSKGQIVTAKGKVSGQPLGNVLLNSCNLQ